MKNLKIVLPLMMIFVFNTIIVLGQSDDLFRIEYLNIPNSNSKNSINRYRAFVQIPLKISEGNYIVVGGDYRYIDLKWNNVPFSTDDLESVQMIEGSIGYIYKTTTSDWFYAGNFGVRLASNFDTKIMSDDVLFLGRAYAIRDKTKEGKADKPNRLILGVEYTTAPGRNYPLPVLNYYREFHPDWSYTLGVPKTNVRYKFDATNHVQAFATLDNIFANIQGNKMIDGKLAENLSSTPILAGLGYEHYFTKHLMYYGYVAYTISNDYRLRNNERDEIYVIVDKNSVYFRTGIKFKY